MPSDPAALVWEVNGDGEPVSSGAYFIAMAAGDYWKLGRSSTADNGAPLQITLPRPVLR